MILPKGLVEIAKYELVVDQFMKNKENCELDDNFKDRKGDKS